MAEQTFFLLLLVLYGVMIVAGGWLFAESGRKHRWRSQGRQRFAILHTVFARQVRMLLDIAAWAPGKLLAAARRILAGLRRHPASAVLALLTLLLPPAVVLLVAGRSLDGYADIPAPVSPVVTALLEGEQLVAPPALPPELFVTKEVEALRIDLGNASREWNALEHDFRQRLLTLYRMMEQRGYRMALLEGYRSPERQAMLSRQGPQVTNAGPYQSYHQHGLAADSAFLRDGRLVISEQDAWAMQGYRLYGEFAESLGLTWGGRWRMRDFGHVELRKSNTLGKY